MRGRRPPEPGSLQATCQNDVPWSKELTIFAKLKRFDVSLNGRCVQGFESWLIIEPGKLCWDGNRRVMPSRWKGEADLTRNKKRGVKIQDEKSDCLDGYTPLTQFPFLLIVKHPCARLPGDLESPLSRPIVVYFVKHSHTRATPTHPFSSHLTVLGDTTSLISRDVGQLCRADVNSLPTQTSKSAVLD